MKVIGVRNAQMTGLSKLIALAKKDGLVVITRNDEPTAMLVSMSLPGIIKLKGNMEKIMKDKTFKTLDQAEQEIIANIINSVTRGVDMMVEEKLF